MASTKEGQPSVRVSVPELTEALRNGGNTPDNRRLAIEIIFTVEQFDPTIADLMDALERRWREAGNVEDSQLDAMILSKPSKSD